MPKPFRIALALLVRPDFSDAEAGRSLPPRINHSKIEFSALIDLLKAWFPYGPSVNIRTPNDTIDFITTQARVNSGNEDAIRCIDFGKALLKCAKNQKTQIIDIQKDWSPLHYLKDRNNAPPPSLITFVIEADDFEDAMIWQSSTLPSIGLPAFNPMDVINKVDKSQQLGKIPEKIKQQLNQIFGCQFEDFVALTTLATDKLPNYVAEAEEYFR